MALETATYIDGLNASNPAASDAISTADDHLRLLKSTIKATFPNISAPVTKTAAEINGLAPLASPTFTGTPAAPTASAGTNTTQVATTAFVGTAVTNERTATATLTNKTLTSPTITGATITTGTINSLTTASIGTNSYGTRTVSTGSPTGGVDGDIWYQV